MEVTQMKKQCWKIGDLVVVYDDEYEKLPTIELYDYETNLSLPRDTAKLLALLILISYGYKPPTFVNKIISGDFYNEDNKKWFSENCIDYPDKEFDTFAEMVEHVESIEEDIINNGFKMIDLPNVK